MDLIVGRIPATGAAADKRADPGAPLEARILHVRQPRRSRDPARAVGEERKQPASQVDPPGARVLVLLVPDGHRLPEDLSQGRYRVFLRVVHR